MVKVRTSSKVMLPEITFHVRRVTITYFIALLYYAWLCNELCEDGYQIDVFFDYFRKMFPVNVGKYH